MSDQSFGIRSLAGVIDDIDGDFLRSLSAGEFADFAWESLPVAEIAGLRIGAPISRPGKIVCIGLNYATHARESGMVLPDEPVVFLKDPQTLVGPTDSVRVPKGSIKTDWEVELGVVIGSRCQYLADEEEALAAIAGYVCSNDVSEREFQLERGGQWDKGKSCETFNPCGPWLVPASAIGDPQGLAMWLDVNGVARQRSTTADMVFSVGYLVWYLSQFMVLYPGDLINTGTPAGVGLGLAPPTFLKAGDLITLGIEGLGQQETPVISYNE